MKARTSGWGTGTRNPSPEVNAMIMVSGTAGGSPERYRLRSSPSGSPEMPANRTTSASVTVRPGLRTTSPIGTSSKYRVASTGRSPPRSGSPLDHDVGLALLHDLTPLVRDRALEHHDPAVGLRGLALVADLDPHLDRVPDLDRSLEPPAQAQEGDGGEGAGGGPAAEARLDGQPEQAVGDALAEDLGPHELGV